MRFGVAACFTALATLLTQNINPVLLSNSEKSKTGLLYITLQSIYKNHCNV